MRLEKDIRLRIDLLEGQSSAIAKILANASREHDEATFVEYSERLATNRGKIEELLWVLGEKAGQSILDLQVTGLASGATVRQIIERLKSGEINMSELPPEVQAIVRRAAVELKDSKNG